MYIFVYRAVGGCWVCLLMFYFFTFLFFILQCSIHMIVHVHTRPLQVTTHCIEVLTSHSGQWLQEQAHWMTGD